MCILKNISVSQVCVHGVLRLQQPRWHALKYIFSFVSWYFLNIQTSNRGRTWATNLLIPRHSSRLTLSHFGSKSAELTSYHMPATSRSWRAIRTIVL